MIRKVKLGDLCSTITSGTTPASGSLDSGKSGVPLIKVQNIIDHTISMDNMLFIDKNVHKTLRRSRVLPGDFLITIAGTIGKAAIVPSDFPEASCNQAIAILRFDVKKLYPKYLLYWLSTNDAHAQIKGRQVTATISNLNLTQIKALEIPLPSLQEQKRIANILDKADSIKQKRQTATKIVDEFLRATFLSMFGDPVINNKNWPQNELKFGIKSIEAGWSAKGENQPCDDSGLGVLKISAVTSGKFKVRENKTVDSATIPPNKKLIKPKKGNLLFSRANTRELVGASCIVDKNCHNVFLPDKLWLVSTDEKKLIPEFLNFLIQNNRFKSKLINQATGTSGSMLNISKQKFKETLVIFPDIKEQKKFKEIYWAVQSSISKITKFKDIGNQLSSALTQQLFGEKNNA